MSPALRLAVRLSATLLFAALASTGLALGIGAALPAAAQLTYYAYTGNRGAIYLYDTERGATARIHRTTRQIMTLAWSPDGEQLAFVTHDNGVYRLRALDMNTGDVRLLTDITASGHRPQWSPDGAWLAFFSQGPGESTLYLLDTDSGAAVETLRGATLGLSWLPDSAQIALVISSGHDDLPAGVYVLPTACAGSACDPVPIVEPSVSDGMPALSPDGAQLAFLSQRDGSWQIYTLDSACLGVKAGCRQRPVRRTFEPGIASTTLLQWSVDSRWIAFEGWPNAISAAVYVLDTACSGCPNAVRSVSDPQDAAFAPAWSPDGCWLAYVARRLDQSRIDMIDTACLSAGKPCLSGVRHVVRSGEIIWFPAWRPTVRTDFSGTISRSAGQ